MGIQRPSAASQSKKDKFQKKVYRNDDGVPHKIDGPAVIYYYTGSITVAREEWRIEGKLHRKGAPAATEFSRMGKVTKELWFFKGVQHRTDGPAEIFYRSNGTMERGYWWVQGYHINQVKGEPNVLNFNEYGDLQTERWVSDTGNLNIRGRFPVAVHYDTDGETLAEEWNTHSSIVEDYDHPVKIGYYTHSPNINYILYAKKEDFYGERILEITYHACGEMKRIISQRGGGLIASSLHEQKGRCTCNERPTESVKTGESTEFLDKIIR